MEDMKQRGWQRRKFSPNFPDDGPWFCCTECAYESDNAKTAATWWEKYDQEKRDKEFQKYCKETPVPKSFIGPGSLLVIVVVGVLLRNCIS